MPHLQLTLSDLLSRLEAFWMESKEGCSAHLLASVTCAAKQKIAGHKYQKTAGDFTPLLNIPSIISHSLSQPQKALLCLPVFQSPMSTKPLFVPLMVMMEMMFLVLPRENLPHVISSLPRPPFPPAGD